MAYYNGKKVLAVNNVIEAQSEHLEIVKAPSSSTFSWKDELTTFCENLNSKNRTSNYLLLTIVSSNDEDFNGATSIVCMKNQVMAGDVNKYRFQGAFIDKDGVTKIVNVVVDTSNENISYTIEKVENEKGEKLYLHHVRFNVVKDDKMADVVATIYTYDETPFTQSSLGDYLKNKGYTSLSSAFIDIKNFGQGVYVTGKLYWWSSRNVPICALSLLKYNDGTWEYTSIVAGTVMLANDTVHEV